MIQVDHLTRRFGRFGAVTAIEDLSFRIEKGELVGFLGPNGAGKTTTLRILTGYLPASSGSAKVCGLDVLRESLAVRQKIGYLPESVPLYREHRVLEMLRFQARLHHLPRAEFARRAASVVERVGLTGLERAVIGTLSRGQRQRVGLALALLPSPEVLILDEPTSGLDPLQRLEFRKLLSELGREHTVLVSSHILPEIEALARRVIILSRGRIAADGTRDELVARLGGGRHVELHAALGPKPAAEAEARALLAKIPGVRAVESLGKLGVHHQFRLRCDEDLREEVGALAAVKGWALRELSYRRPTLEELFARIALDIGGLAPAPAGEPPASTVPAATAAAMAASPLLQIAPPPSSAPAAAPGGAAGSAARPAPARPVYNLNPFEQGARRDLSKPKPPGATSSAADQEGN